MLQAHAKPFCFRMVFKYFAMKKVEIESANRKGQAPRSPSLHQHSHTHASSLFKPPRLQIEIASEAFHFGVPFVVNWTDGQYPTVCLSNSPQRHFFSTSSPVSSVYLSRSRSKRTLGEAPVEIRRFSGLLPSSDHRDKKSTLRHHTSP